MKRNWDIIRELLTRLEECTLRSDAIRLSHFPNDREAEISYHMVLLIEAGLVTGKANVLMNQLIADFYAERLTWEGHEFLDSIRSDTAWARTKKAFLDRGVEMSFDLVKAYAKDAAATLMEGAFGS
jgi:hypothetical protein